MEIENLNKQITEAFWKIIELAKNRQNLNSGTLSREHK